MQGAHSRQWFQQGPTPEVGACTHRAPFSANPWLCCRNWAETWKAKRAAWHLLVDINCPVLLVSLELMTTIF